MPPCGIKMRKTSLPHDVVSQPADGAYSIVPIAGITISVDIATDFGILARGIELSSNKASNESQ